MSSRRDVLQGFVAGAVAVPAAAAIFRFAPLGAGDLAAALVAGVAGVAWIEAWKLLRAP